MKEMIRKIIKAFRSFLSAEDSADLYREAAMFSKTFYAEHLKIYRALFVSIALFLSRWLCPGEPWFLGDFFFMGSCVILIFIIRLLYRILFLYNYKARISNTKWSTLPRIWIFLVHVNVIRITFGLLLAIGLFGCLYQYSDVPSFIEVQGSVISFLKSIT
jgi:hypothetical protein